MSAELELITVRIEKPEELNLILGQAHFIKTVEDLYETLAGSSPHLRLRVVGPQARPAGGQRRGARRARRSQRPGDRGGPLVHRLPA